MNHLPDLAGRRGSWKAARRDVLDARVLRHDFCQRAGRTFDGDGQTGNLGAGDEVTATWSTDLLVLSFAWCLMMGKMAYCCWFHGMKLVSRELRDDRMARRMDRISIPS